MRKVSLVLAFILCFSLTYSFATPSDWAIAEIDKANNYGLTTKSVLANYQQSITREEFAELSVKLYEALSGQEAIPISPNPFTDTNSIETLKANNLGIVSGVGGGKFAPKDTVTREQVAAMFSRLLSSLDINPIVTMEYRYFADEDEISDWAKGSVQMMNKLGILGGVGNSRINPKGTTTREQAIALVTRTYEKFESDVDKDNGTNRSEMFVHFIDVGQGDSILIVSPSGKVMLIDAGDLSAGEKIVSYLKKAGITTIDKFVVTHPHADHIGGAQHVFNNFEVKKVYDSGFVHTSKIYEEYLTTIDNKNIDFEIATRSYKIDLDEKLSIDILHSGVIKADANNNSIVLRLTYNEISFLFTGDVEKAAEDMIIKYSNNIKSQILKVGHHGSSTSTTQAFLDAINPKVAIIQVDEGNIYGHPTEEVLKRLVNVGAEIYRNDLHGDIVLTTNGSTYEVNKKPFIYVPIGINLKIDINTASFDELMKIIHIDADRAGQILKLRPFKAIDDLERVSGIASQRIADIKKEGIAYVSEIPKVEPKGTININTASLKELQEIIHISEARAKQLIELRPFTSINQLTKISGIADARLKDIIEEGKAYVD